MGIFSGIIQKFENWGNHLTTNPLGFLVYMITFIIAILLTLVLHEWAHGYVAYRCGDPTAKMLGRLSLNPAKHLDPIGTACLVLFGFGWAKPVPVNPRNFRNYRRDDFLVSIAGISVNLTMFLLFSALYVGLYALVVHNPLLLTSLWFNPLFTFIQMVWAFNLSVGIFNLLPIPPLDGFHIFNDILFKGKIRLNAQAFQITQVIVIVLMVTGMFSQVVGAITGFIQNSVFTFYLSLAGLG